MKKLILFLVFCIFSVCLIPKASQPCTTFCLDQGDQLVVGKNFDWHIGEALVIVNKRNVSKTALPNPNDDGQPASWISKYGSVTFNPFGLEFSFSGMNEAGLVVSAMALQQTEYPEPDSQPYIRQKQWKQYQLDNFSTVEEVIASDSQLRISKEELLFGGHFLICDSMGNCAIIEFIDGERVYYTNETMPVKVLTNSTYAESIEYWKQHELPTPDLYFSVWRFITVADMLKNYDPETSGSAVNYAFDILGEVSAEERYYQGKLSATRWSIVYDIQNLRINFRTLENEQIRHLDLSSFDFSCKTPVKVLGINDDLSGDVSNNFVDYTYEINRDLIEKTLPDKPDEEKDTIAHYPETTVCTEIDCFIATAAYGSLMEPQVKILCEFRDRFLLDNTVGNSFVNLYNTYSPPIADFIAKHDNVRAMVRLSLLPIIGVSCVALKLSLVPTMLLLLLLLISTTTVVVFRKRWLRGYKI